MILANLKQYKGNKIDAGNVALNAGGYSSHIFKKDSKFYITHLAVTNDLASDDVTITLVKSPGLTLKHGDTYNSQTVSFKDAFIAGDANADLNFGGRNYLLAHDYLKQHIFWQIENCDALFSAIPSQIISGGIDFAISGFNPAGALGDLSVKAYQLLKTWGEGNNNGTTADAGECSYNAAQEGTADWDTAGASGAGDVSSTVVGRLRSKLNSLIGESLGRHIIDIDNSILSGWITSPSGNKGLKINCDASTATHKQFRVHAKEVTSAWLKPKFHLAYMSYAENGVANIIDRVSGNDAINYIPFDSPIPVDTDEAVTLLINNNSSDNLDIAFKLGVIQ